MSLWLSPRQTCYWDGSLILEQREINFLTLPIRAKLKVFISEEKKKSSTEKEQMQNKYYRANLSISGHYLLNEVSSYNVEKVKQHKQKKVVYIFHRIIDSIRLIKNMRTKANKYFEHTYLFVAHFNGFAVQQNWYWNSLQTFCMKYCVYQ